MLFVILVQKLRPDLGHVHVGGTFRLAGLAGQTKVKCFGQLLMVERVGLVGMGQKLPMIAYLFSVILLPLFSRMLKEGENIGGIVRSSTSLLAFFSITSTTLLLCFRFPVLELLYTEHVNESAAVFSHPDSLHHPDVNDLRFRYIADSQRQYAPAQPYDGGRHLRKSVGERTPDSAAPCMRCGCGKPQHTNGDVNHSDCHRHSCYKALRQGNANC